MKIDRTRLPPVVGSRLVPHACGCVERFDFRGPKVTTHRFVVRCMKRVPGEDWHRYGSRSSVVVRPDEVPKP